VAARNGAGSAGAVTPTEAQKEAFASRKPSNRSNNLPQLSREEWSRCIAAAWAKGVEAFVETGRQLIEAKRALDYGKFLDMIENDLPFSASTAERLMAIAKNTVLSDSAHAPKLPPSWTTLYELTKLPAQKLRSLIKNGSVHPAMERRDAESLTPQPPARPRRPSAMRQVSDALAKTISSMAGAPPPSDAAVVEDHHPSLLDTSAACSPVTAELKDIERKATEIIEAPPDRLQILLAAWNAAPDDVRLRFLDFIGARLDDGIPDSLRRDRVQP
jgi:hypothetical protein